MSETHCPRHNRKWYRCCDPESNMEMHNRESAKCQKCGSKSVWFTRLPCDPNKPGGVDSFHVQPEPPAPPDLVKAAKRAIDRACCQHTEGSDDRHKAAHAALDAAVRGAAEKAVDLLCHQVNRNHDYAPDSCSTCSEASTLLSGRAKRKEAANGRD